MFGDLKRAWRQAVENFWRELEGDQGAPATAASTGAYRELATARDHVARLDREIARARHSVRLEREQVDVCARRQRMAEEIGDAETARVASRFGQRHRERAEVLDRKVEVLSAERRICLRDLHEMERALQAEIRQAEADLHDLTRHPREREFQDLENIERVRTADERLNDLKRRLG